MLQHKIEIIIAIKVTITAIDLKIRISIGNLTTVNNIHNNQNHKFENQKKKANNIRI